METVYVRLLNEGTAVYRPVPALSLGDGKFRLGAPQDFGSPDEEWEFPTDSVVRVKKQVIEGTEVLVALSRE